MLHPAVLTGDGPVLATAGDRNARISQYEVIGRPPGQTALIGLHDGRWQILRGKGEWVGAHASAEDALAVLQAEFPS